MRLLYISRSSWFSTSWRPHHDLCPNLFVPSGDVFEQGVVLSVKQKDEGSFERNFQQLRPFYADLRCGFREHRFPTISPAVEARSLRPPLLQARDAAIAE